MKKLLLLSLCLTGCAVLPQQWSHSTKPESQFAADQERCQVEAKVNVQKPHAPESKVDLQGLARIFRIMEERNLESQYQADLRGYVSDCLQAQGWVLK
jgi:hypothetical protein